MIGEIEEIKIYVNNETYTKYKKTLEDEIDELQQQNQKYKDVIDKAIEYLEAKRIREKAIVDIDVLEGILKEVE